MLADNALENYYQESYELIKHNRMTLTEIENMYPFERAIYSQLLIIELKKRQEEANGR